MYIILYTMILIHCILYTSHARQWFTDKDLLAWNIHLNIGFFFYDWYWWIYSTDYLQWRNIFGTFCQGQSERRGYNYSFNAGGRQEDRDVEALSSYSLYYLLSYQGMEMPCRMWKAARLLECLAIWEPQSTVAWSPGVLGWWETFEGDDVGVEKKSPCHTYGTRKGWRDQISGDILALRLKKVEGVDEVASCRKSITYSYVCCQQMQNI